MIRFGDEIYDSPSKAALVAGLTVYKDCNTPNGYKWWNVQRDGKWVPIEKLAKLTSNPGHSQGFFLRARFRSEGQTVQPPLSV
jgi:hypothetical protein